MIGRSEVFVYQTSSKLISASTLYTEQASTRGKGLKQTRAWGLTTSWLGTAPHSDPQTTRLPEHCHHSTVLQVYHSQSLTDKLLRPWVITEPDGNIITAHCTCMAGLWETCSHVAALLFSVDVAVRLRDSKTPAQFPAGWAVPSAKEGIYLSISIKQNRLHLSPDKEATDGSNN